jgi:hypothetical protein
LLWSGVFAGQRLGKSEVPQGKNSQSYFLYKTAKKSTNMGKVNFFRIFSRFAHSWESSGIEQTSLSHA